MAESCDLGEFRGFPTVVERYYIPKYAINVGGEGEDQYVYLHTNGLLVVGLTRNHRLFLESKVVESVDFCNESRDLSKNSVRGTKKRV